MTKRFAVFFLTLYFGVSTLSAQDKVITKDGRVIEGKVIKDERSGVTIKKKYGNVIIPRKNVKSVVRGEGESSSAGAKKSSGKALEAFKNGFYNYKIARASKSWIYKETPPEPLCDLVIYNEPHDAELKVVVLPDENPDLKLIQKNAEAVSESIRRKLREKYYSVEIIQSKAFQFKNKNALESKLKGKSKFDNVEVVFKVIFVKARKRFYHLVAVASSEHFGAIDGDVQKMLDGFQFIEAKDMDDGVYSNFKHLYRIRKPESWKLSKTESGSEFKSADGKATVTVEVKELIGKKPIEDVARERAQYLEKRNPGYQNDGRESLNIMGTVAQQLKYRDKTRHGDRTVRELLIKADTRLYVVRGALLSVDKGAHMDALNQCMESFVVQRNLTSKSSVENGFKAIDRFDAGDQALLAGDVDGAIPHYQTALDLFPNFAAAVNNLALCYGRKKFVDRYFNTMRKAYQLFPESKLFKGNMASAYNSRAIARMNKGKNKEAIADLTHALKLDRKNEALAKNLAIAHFNIGIKYTKKRLYSKAISSFKEAKKLDPENKNLPKAMADVYVYIANDFARKKRWSKAKRYVRKALKADPGNSRAKKLEAQIDKLSKR